jgi:uncharacterized membrane protein YoaK (UPF0700 family)
MTSQTRAAREPLVTVLLVLTATTGLVDAVSVLGLGHVFTANMTGNVVFLGFAATGEPDFSAARCALAIVTFVVGAAAGGRLAAAMAGRTYRRWLLTAGTIECVLFLTAALLSRDYDQRRLAPAWKVGALLVLTAAAMGVRNATVRRLGVPDLTTTVLTMTFTGLGADSRFAGGSDPRWGRRTLSVLAMLLGAMTGAWLMQHTGVAAPLALTGVVVLGGVLAYAWHPASLRSVEAAPGH